MPKRARLSKEEKTARTRLERLGCLLCVDLTEKGTKKAFILEDMTCFTPEHQSALLDGKDEDGDCPPLSSLGSDDSTEVIQVGSRHPACFLLEQVTRESDHSAVAMYAGVPVGTFVSSSTTACSFSPKLILLFKD